MRRDRFESFLWGQVLLVGLLAASLALFLTYPSLRTPYHLPGLHLVLATVFMLTGGLVAVLAATRFTVDGRRFDLVLASGFAVGALSWLAFDVVPGLRGREAFAASSIGDALGWALIAAAPFAAGRSHRRAWALWGTLLPWIVALVPVWLAARALGSDSRAGFLGLQALFQLAAAVTFGNRYRTRGEDLDQWLSVAATLTLVASLSQMFAPGSAPSEVARGEMLVLLADGILLVGLWRAIRASEFGRAVAEERARVAREIHDGLAQYLFSVSTNAALLEAGGDPATTLARLRAAAEAAQQEARFAVLALSSASGRASFDGALRRYVDVLTADGALAVELEIDRHIRLGPDEQIEVFRIVQEGLANARRHSGARRAWVAIADRGGARVVAIRDDGAGFAPGTDTRGHGLRNMRERAASIGGALTLRTAPGGGTALEVVLRA